MARTPYLNHPGPVPLAHQGFSPQGLQCSMAAFAEAVCLGYRYLETDVHATKDDVLVVFHDATLDRVTDSSGAIADLTWREVSAARIGGVEAIPRLEDLLGTWPEVRVNIDVKAPEAITPLARVLERTRSHDRVCIASFSDRRRRAVLRRLSRPVATSAGRERAVAFLIAAALPQARRGPAVARALAGIDLLQVPEHGSSVPVVTAATVAAAHAAGVGVHVWTVNEAADMTRLLDLGVDGIVTDRADVLKEVLQARGQWR